MCDIQHEISRLLHFARQKGLIAPEDEVYAANRLLDVLHVEEYVPEEVEETLETATPILECMLDYAAEKGLIEGTRASSMATSSGRMSATSSTRASWTV